MSTPINAETLLRSIVESATHSKDGYASTPGNLVNAARLWLSRDPSELRQYLNVLSEQLKSDQADRAVIFQTCKLIAMVAASEKPIPEDVFAPGIDDRIARLMLSSACMMAMQMASAPVLAGLNRIASRGKPPINGA